MTEVRAIAEAIQGTTGIDFSNYAFSSFRRRVERFIESHKVKDIDVFIGDIKNNSDLANRLVSEITVNVTEMFRDPSFWLTLRNIILPKLDRNEVIRIWHAACSTGEEVFSMAILLKEEGLLRRARIVATDINPNVLGTAKGGIYQLKNLEVNTRNYEQSGGKSKLSDYYSVAGGSVCFDRRLIENVSFSRNDLSRDGDPGQFDLILCRNVLIYFNFDLQEKVIQVFARSMPGGAFLAIGSKESISWCRSGRFYEPECIEEKIYRKIDTRVRLNNIVL